jgi:hypothetical protein
MCVRLAGERGLPRTGLGWPPPAAETPPGGFFSRIREISDLIIISIVVLVDFCFAED